MGFFEFYWEVLVRSSEGGFGWAKTFIFLLVVAVGFLSPWLRPQTTSNLQSRISKPRVAFLVAFAFFLGWVPITIHDMWQEEHSTRLTAERELVKIKNKTAELSDLSSLIEEGLSIQKTFIAENNTGLIKSQFEDWNSKVEKEIKEKLDNAYLSQYRTAHGGASMPVGHSVEGGAIWAEIQSKLAVLSTIMESIRRS